MTGDPHKQQRQEIKFFESWKWNENRAYDTRKGKLPH